MFGRTALYARSGNAVEEISREGGQVPVSPCEKLGVTDVDGGEINADNEDGEEGVLQLNDQVNARGQRKVTARSPPSQRNVTAESTPGQRKVKTWSTQGQHKVNTRSPQGRGEYKVKSTRGQHKVNTRPAQGQRYPELPHLDWSLHI